MDSPFAAFFRRVAITPALCALLDRYARAPYRLMPDANGDLEVREGEGNWLVGRIDVAAPEPRLIPAEAS